MTFNFPNPDVLYFNRNEHHTNRALASDITNQIWSDRIHLSNFARLVAVDPTAYSNEKVSLYALALGHEDLNDHRELRHDLALQTAANRVESLASPSTLCRLEQRADRDTAWAIHEVLFEQFVAAHPVPPRRLILDFDATDTPLHGEQEDRFFHTYYGGYCYLPLYVFCGRHLLVSYLRPSGRDGAHHAWAILSFLVKALRARWPKVEIVFRGDSGFCRWRMLRWCESRGVRYIVGNWICSPGGRPVTASGPTSSGNCSPAWPTP